MLCLNGRNVATPGAWSKGINIHSFSQDKEETIKLFLERRVGDESTAHYEVGIRLDRIE